MATRSTIAMEFPNGTVKQVYCHWDGYLEHNGTILFNHYSDPEKLEKLISLGAISSLGPDIGEKHDFDCPFKYGTPEYDAYQKELHKITTCYCRDRGEPLEFNFYESFEDYAENAQQEEYNYIRRKDGYWLVQAYAEAPQLLERALIENSEREAA